MIYRLARRLTESNLGGRICGVRTATTTAMLFRAAHCTKYNVKRRRKNSEFRWANTEKQSDDLPSLSLFTENWMIKYR